MLFLQYFMINLVLTKSSGPKRHAVAFSAPILPVSVCVTQISVGGGGLVGGEAGGTGLHNRASVQVGGGGWVAVGVGGKSLNWVKARSRQKCVCSLTDCRFHRPLSVFT